MDTVNSIASDHQKLAADLAAQGVEYAFGSFIDITGRAKSKVIPIDHLANLLAGSERYTPRGMGDLGRMTPHEDECVAMPDPTTLRICPWDRRYAWFAADLLYGGVEPFAHCTRSILKKQVDKAAAAGVSLNLGVEVELHVFKEVRDDGYLVPVAKSGELDPTPAYDVEVAMDAMGFLDPMAKALSETGFGLFSFDTEGGDAQYEFDFTYAPALEMGDRIAFFRLMAKQIAKQAGLVATFMPKPYTEAWGSGAHFNMSLEDIETGTNLFRDPDDARGKGWSKQCYSFVAGIIKHAPAIAAVATPTVNSYKRLSPRLADGTISWAPIYAAYGDNNRSCMLRLPRNRPAIENRGVDSAANVYITTALMLAAGLEGIELGLDPGDPVEDQTYDWTKTRDNAVRLPRTLLEAIEAFATDELVADVFSPHFVDAYVEMKTNEWDDYHRRVTDWERDKYLLMF